MHSSEPEIVKQGLIATIVCLQGERDAERSKVVKLFGAIDVLTKERDALRAEIERERARADALRDGIGRCYRMLLSEPDTKGALFKAENILRDLCTAAPVPAAVPPWEVRICPAVDMGGQEDAHFVTMKRGVQMFSVGEQWDTREEAEWFADMLRKALAAPVPASDDAKDAKRCSSCANRGRVDGASQESHCEHCIWNNQWLTDRYKPIDAAMRERSEG